jgi:hypothetical protein
MNKLPNELLLDIFEYLPGVDLVSLSGVCRNFNEIISNTELSKKLTLHFRKLNENVDEVVNCRRYENLKIGFYKPSLHPLILKEIGSNLNSIEFAYCNLKLDIVRRILGACPNVKRLKFFKAHLSDVPNSLRLPLPVLINVDLTFTYSDPRIFKILNNCVVRKLYLDHKYKMATENVDDFMEFLSRQDHLEDLTLTHFFRTNLFITNWLNLVTFRLKVLRLLHVSLARTVHFKEFLAQNHLDTLQVLEIKKLDKCNLTNIINFCSYLKELKIDELESLAEVEELKSLEKLAIFAQLPLTLDQLIHKFPSLQVVETNYCRLIYDEDEFLRVHGRISYPKNFLELHVIDTTITMLRTKTIKKLVLKNARINDDDFFEANHQIEELFIENCHFGDDIMAKFIHTMPNLTKFSIADEIITQNTIDCIYYKCVHLKTLRLKLKDKNSIDLTMYKNDKDRNVKIYFIK